METVDDALTTGTNRALSGISGRMLEKIALWRLKAASSVRAMERAAARFCHWMGQRHPPDSMPHHGMEKAVRPAYRAGHDARSSLPHDHDANQLDALNPTPSTKNRSLFLLIFITPDFFI
jgi:hypothetical protein